MAQVLTEKIDEITLIQATLIAARLEQPGLPRYQFTAKEYELIHEAFGNTSGLSAKVIKVMPMSPMTEGEPKKTVGWIMEIGDAWSALFQIEKVEKTWQNRVVYNTWPLIEFRRGRILFLKNGVQVSDGLGARISKRTYVFKKDTGWVSNKEEKK
jgi:hypothetical protein